MPMECEMCGRKVDRPHKVRIDNAILNVCDSCSKFGTPVDARRSYNALEKGIANQSMAVKIPEKKPSYIQPAKRRPKPRAGRENIENLDIVEDYAERIKSARSKLSWTQEDLAKKLLERKNVLSNIERGELMPNIKIARKLERLLGITLVVSE